MGSLVDFFTSVGSDAQSVVGRLGGNEALVLRFVTKFNNDGSYKDLSEALKKGDTEKAFRAAHTLKGVSGTLGFQNLYTKASSITELLRGGDLKAAEALMSELDMEYKKVMEALKMLEQQSGRKSPGYCED